MFFLCTNFFEFDTYYIKLVQYKECVGQTLNKKTCFDFNFFGHFGNNMNEIKELEGGHIKFFTFGT